MGGHTCLPVGREGRLYKFFEYYQFYSGKKIGARIPG